MEYTAWLIEIDWGKGPVYHQFQIDDDWTKNQDAACHFSRKQDAEQVIAYYGWTRAVAVEHMWPKVEPREPRTAAGSLD